MADATKHGWARGYREGRHSWHDTVEGALTAARLVVNPCETARVTLRQRYEFGIFGFHSTLHNVDQNDHLVD